MGIINRSRVLRPSTREVTSTSYKVDTEKVTAGDTLVVKITHETLAYSKEYKFKGADVAQKNSIHFKATEQGGRIEIKWMGIDPI